MTDGAGGFNIQFSVCGLQKKEQKHYFLFDMYDQPRFADCRIGPGVSVITSTVLFDDDHVVMTDEALILTMCTKILSVGKGASRHWVPTPIERLLPGLYSDAPL